MDCGKVLGHCRVTDIHGRVQLVPVQIDPVDKWAHLGEVVGGVLESKVLSEQNQDLVVALANTAKKIAMKDRA